MECTSENIWRHAQKRHGRPADTSPVPSGHAYPSPEFDTVVIPAPQHAPLQVTVLIEQKQRMIAGALEVAVVDGALLVPMGAALRAH